jgi:5-(carboxyamino)imidazole ribonucleotide mutase
MPAGVPVATVALDGARNAGILAAQILSTQNSRLASKLASFKAGLQKKVEESAREIGRKGWKGG